MKNVIDEDLEIEGQLFAEIFTDTNQIFEPKSATKKMEDGSLKRQLLKTWHRFYQKMNLHQLYLYH